MPEGTVATVCKLYPLQHSQFSQELGLGSDYYVNVIFPEELVTRIKFVGECNGSVNPQILRSFYTWRVFHITGLNRLDGCCQSAG